MGDDCDCCSSGSCCCDSFCTDFYICVFRHAQRACIWRLRDIELTTNEFDTLRKIGVENLLLTKYLVWRKSSLLVTSIFVVITAAVSTMGIQEVDWNSFNGFGKFAQTMQLVTPWVLAVSVVLSLIWSSKNPHRSIVMLAYGWLIALILPLWPAIFPFEYYMDGFEEIFDVTYQDDTVNDIILLVKYTLRANEAASYAIKIFPVVATVPSGIIRGALRIRGLVPESTLAGWLIVIAAPFYPLIILLAFVLLSQLFGNFLLVVGCIFFMVAPTLYIFRRKLYTSPTLTEAENNHLEWNQRIIAGLTGLGVILIGIWAILQDLLLLSVADSIIFFFSFVGRLLSTTVVFADLTLRITIANSSMERELSESIGAEELDDMMLSLEEDFEGCKEPEVASSGVEFATVSVKQVHIPAPQKEEESVDVTMISSTTRSEHKSSSFANFDEEKGAYGRFGQPSQGVEQVHDPMDSQSELEDDSDLAPDSTRSKEKKSKKSKKRKS